MPARPRKPPEPKAPTGVSLTPLGTLIRSLCDQQGLSLGDLGRRLGHDHRSAHARVSQILRAPNLHTDTVLGLARSLGVDPAILFAAVAEGTEKKSKKS